MTKATAVTPSAHKALARMLNYLALTQDMGLTLAPKDLNLAVFADASFNVHHDSHSHLGMFHTVGGSPLLASSKKIQLMTTSSTEAETQAAFQAAKDAVWILSLAKELGLPDTPVVLYQDNQSTIDIIVRGHAPSSRTRHWNVRVHTSTWKISRW